MTRKKMNLKRVLCFVLVCVMAAGIVVIPFQMLSAGDSPEEVSDYFFVQLYDGEDQVVSKYKVTLTGTVSRASRKITAISAEHVSGDVCESTYQIENATAEVFLTHPTEGRAEYHFMLDSSGVFSGY